MKYKNYVRVRTLEEAYSLNRKKSNRILGGTLWMRQSRNPFGTAIDLSALGLDQIEETKDAFFIGCMTTLRQLELHPGLDALSRGAIAQSVRHIVGVQFRNLATVGGSIFGRFGFSDVLTMFLALETEVELYPSGIVSLQEFAQAKRTDDILVRLIVKKKKAECVYLSQRNTKTDFPVLTCAASLQETEGRIVIGATPARARVCSIPDGLVQLLRTGEDEAFSVASERFAGELASSIATGGNIRGSAEYRTHLIRVLSRRALAALRAQAQGGLMDAKETPGEECGAELSSSGRVQTSENVQDCEAAVLQSTVSLSLTLNGRPLSAQVKADQRLYDFLREHGCYSVKCGCDTSNCGLCTVLLDGVPVLSCSVPAARVDGRRVDTLEGLRQEAEEFGRFVAQQGAEQCGFCNPGMIMNAIAMFREIPEPTDTQVQEYLAGNLCRCSGYEGQTRAIREFMAWKAQQSQEECAQEERAGSTSPAERRTV